MIVGESLKKLLKSFFCRITLPGSAEGIRYYLSPDFDAIYKAEVWVDGEFTFVSTLSGLQTSVQIPSRYASFLLFGAGIWCPPSLCELQQVPQQCIQVILTPIHLSFVLLLALSHFQRRSVDFIHQFGDKLRVGFCDFFSAG
jgi:hypothetical protein